MFQANLGKYEPGNDFGGNHRSGFDQQKPFSCNFQLAMDVVEAEIKFRRRGGRNVKCHFFNYNAHIG